MSEQGSVLKRDIRKVRDVVPRPGGGPHLKVAQVLDAGNWRETDPFLFLAEDWFQQGTFDFHPHRGMETVTYVIEGRLKHEDNHGGYGVLTPGDVQWMTAGRGIIHSEDPLPGETVHSLQLWLNLPRAKKRVEPRYQDLHAGDVPVLEQEGVRVKVFSGQSGAVKARTENHVPATFLEMNLEPGAQFRQRLPGAYNGFLYILEGSGKFGADGTPGKKNQVLWLGGAETGQDSEISIAADERLKVLLYAGEPIGEPVVARGPFVMNTEEEIREAFADFYAGKFGRV